ncbi:unnamed protein product [Prorocentrum cordatum]|uniref:PH domain-containing protein n=1 Tax=Prorocentrum cordatum TaxID=2364126 RepID=A0ABN9VIF8_9DINO|nr:unnamed protein product [Polarella glacialis]
MSCRVAPPKKDDALALCVAVLACREEFPKKEDWLRSLASATDSSQQLRNFLNRSVAYEQYKPAAAEWESRATQVDAVNLLETRKLNREELDKTTVLNLKTAARVDGRSLHRRAFCAVVSLLNGAAVAEHLEASTRGKKNVKASEIIRLAEEVPAENCFTNAFDARAHSLPADKKEERKDSRPRQILLTETADAVHLKEAGWKKRACIRRAVRYGGLLGKNAVALPTLAVPDGGCKKEQGCLPGPGARSGYSFLIHAAKSPAEKEFWRRLAARLELWRDGRQQDDLRLQFRLCEMSKIAGIVRRNAGRRRGGPVADAAGADLMEQDEPLAGAGAESDSEGGGAKARATKTLAELKLSLVDEEARIGDDPASEGPPVKRAKR